MQAFRVGVVCGMGTIASAGGSVSAQEPAPVRYAASILKSQKPEPPQTPLEATVQREGRNALPLVWDALATGTESERRAAAALLSWYRDVRSIRPILAELDKSPSPLIRQQLLFDLNMILLTEGSPANDAQTIEGLAAAHLRRAYAELASETANDLAPDSVLWANTLAVFPDPGVPDSVSLSGETQRARSPRGQQLPTRVETTAVRSASPQAFIQAVAKGYGVAFHVPRIADGVARVATTLYFPNGGASNAFWVSLYRRSGGEWLPICIPPQNPSRNGPPLLPTIDRDYGPDDPLKIMGLDLAMERVRVDVNSRLWLGWENGDWWSSRSRILDATYAPLFEMYKRSDSPSVRYTAEFEAAILTGQPDLQLWLAALAGDPQNPIQTMARRVIGSYAQNQVKSEGQTLTGAARDQLVAAAMKPQAVGASVLPSELPRTVNIKRVEASTRFGLVEVVLPGQGYTMLFERRGQVWSYLFNVSGWIE